MQISVTWYDVASEDNSSENSHTVSLINDENFRYK